MGPAPKRRIRPPGSTMVSGEPQCPLKIFENRARTAVTFMNVA
jgi:hypothetical protein